MNFSVNSLSQTLEEEGCNNKFPVIVHVLHFDKQSKKVIAEHYTDPQLQEMINVQFQSFGYDPSKYELEECLAPFIDIPYDLNSFIVFRVNVFNEIERLGSAKLNELSSTGIRK